MPSSIEVSPLEIRRKIQQGEEYEEALTIRNTSEERSSYSIRAEDGFQEWVEVEPELFSINPQDARAIALVLKTDNAKMGANKFVINVVHEGSEDVTAEVKVTLIRPRLGLLWGAGLAVILALLAVLRVTGVFQGL